MKLVAEQERGEEDYNYNGVVPEQKGGGERRKGGMERGREGERKVDSWCHIPCRHTQVGAHDTSMCTSMSPDFQPRSRDPQPSQS